ncbi:MAG: ribosome recycling factor, partial [Clostridia bacterium]|nr:ribosome recycling factor [Clostridia bacterium]
MEKAIQMSDVGINPQNDGTVLRLVFPQLTEERRKALAKQVKGMGEEAKVALRNIRRDAMDETKKAKKDGTMTEDEVKDAEKAIQDVTDKYIKKVDALTSAKEKELMAI